MQAGATRTNTNLSIPAFILLIIVDGFLIPIYFMPLPSHIQRETKTPTMAKMASWLVNSRR